MNEPKLSVVLYGELDPHFGSIKQALSDLPKVVNQLKVACLLYDRVIINTNAFNEHCLTLPALEQLKPFVQSGVLWTTGNQAGESPADFIARRIEKYSQEATMPFFTNSILKKTIDRFAKIAPSSFEVYRSPNIQSISATKNLQVNLMHYFDQHRLNTTPYQKISERLNDMHSEGRFSKQELFALMLHQKNMFDYTNLQTTALLIQAEYMNQGARHKSQSQIDIFSGEMAHRLESVKDLMHQNRFNTSRRKLTHAHFLFFQKNPYIQTLLKIPVQQLFQISQAADWQVIRQHIQKELSVPNINPPSIYIEDKIEKTSRFLQAEAEIGATSFEPWTRYTIASSGIQGQYPAQNQPQNCLLLNHATRKLINTVNHKTVELSQLDMDYLILATQCTTGENLRSLFIQYKIESEILQSRGCQLWINQAKRRAQNEDLYLSLYDKVEKGLQKVQRQLAKIDCTLYQLTHYYGLKSLTNNIGYTLLIKHTLISPLTEQQHFFDQENQLLGKNKIQLVIYHTLKEKFPFFVSNRQLCDTVLQQCFRTLSTTQISRNIYKINQKLKSAGSPTIIISDTQGCYRML